MLPSKMKSIKPLICPTDEEPTKIKKALTKCISLDEEVRDRSPTKETLVYRAICPSCAPSCVPACQTKACQNCPRDACCECVCCPPLLDQEIMVEAPREDKENYVIPQPVCDPSCCGVCGGSLRCPPPAPCPPPGCEPMACPPAGCASPCPPCKPCCFPAPCCPPACRSPCGPTCTPPDFP